MKCEHALRDGLNFDWFSDQNKHLRKIWIHASRNLVLLRNGFTLFSVRLHTKLVCMPGRFESHTTFSRKKHTNLTKVLMAQYVCKFSNFPVTLFLREINFGAFHKDKNWHFNNFESFEFWFLEISLLKRSEIPKTSKFRAAKMIKMAVFGA